MSKGYWTLIRSVVLMILYSILVAFGYQIETTPLPLYYEVLLWVIPILSVAVVIVTIIVHDPRLPRIVTWWPLLQLIPLLLMVAVVGAFTFTLDAEQIEIILVFIPIAVWPMYLFVSILFGLIVHGAQVLHLRRLSSSPTE